MSSESEAYYKSELGIIKVTAEDDAITSLYFQDEAPVVPAPENAILKECLRQLDEYFCGKRQSFTLKLKPAGTEFQKRVWDELLKIPFGKTISYLELANRLGDKKLIRAVGGANGRNKISVIIPCHRVIGNNGELIGYGGGLWRKEWLLNHEGSFLSFRLFQDVRLPRP